MRIGFRFLLMIGFLTGALAGAPAQAQSFGVTKNSDVDLGSAYAPATFSGSYHNTIGTNGSMSYASTYTGPAVATAGSLRITGPAGTVVQISCDENGSMRNTGGCCGNQHRGIDQTRFTVGTSNARGPGLGSQCSGLNDNVVTHTLTGNAAQDTILLGGRMHVTNVRIGGQYVTTNRKPITVRVRRISPGASATIDTDVHWYAAFESSISFSTTNTMQFGTINFSNIGSSDRANLATNNAMTYTGSFSGPSTGIAGYVSVQGVENNVTLEVYCDTNAVLTRSSGGGSIQVTNLEVDTEDSRGAIGTGSPCQGVAAPAVTFNYNNPSRDTIYIGGRLNGSTATGLTNGGTFSTANSGGNNIEFIVLNQ